MKETNNTILGVSSNFLDVLERASELAKLNKPVLVIGERGTGKELIADRLHYLSPRWQEPFISLNCSGLNENLLDSELFGHEAGSFTGAQKRHQGRFERADKGTLFLDELATAPMSVQEKLLRVIEYGELERVGGSQSLKVDVRLVCATNANLPELARQGLFRADLLDRIAFEVIRMPPLRERVPDILLLAEHFAIGMVRELKRDYFTGFSDNAQQTLMHYSWPGNIRELKNVVERSVYRHGESDLPVDTIILDPFGEKLAELHEIPAASSENSKLAPVFPFDLRQWQLESEKQYVEEALRQANFNQRKAAQCLSLSYDQFRGLIKKHHISLES
ncbi:phage shock protein operon transcriptional activator [Providencia sp. PROV188]|jgi:psp operon transcriptional activator|uniref:phage shock protein operon transcriptional activator n=1 Tax=Providencia TaxID=586 RepID=UPI0003E2360C|nr:MULTISPECIES: phage shock protein operon transcriptional activator [Providencia]ETS99704.1 psp operon transcriptional activator [Providencia alcalifaciens PAL-3]EUD00266.1 psp operon transcriptional activator [Providencia alcalifaciens PAL-1]MBG5881913.1 phage shock protein operon transcriptional activator [Providencia alcalifaciens]MDR2242050.1 phage shock protein operon transcriptional activator [Providencia alcalifaciens]MTB45193.1 phage shock protein operon transcriptional activator [Pr